MVTLSIVYMIGRVTPSLLQIPCSVYMIGRVTLLYCNSLFRLHDRIGSPFSIEIPCSVYMIGRVTLLYCNSLFRLHDT